jgi:O-antigen/teichoic acid export membrane protein
VTAETSLPKADAASTREDLTVAGRNALTLAASLVGTWGVAFLVRFQLPRFLGPAAFGEFNFADAFSAAFFVLADFGIDVYAVKETAARPAHASDFTGGVLVVRALTSLLLFAAMAITLGVTHRSADVQLAVFVFGLTQFVMLANGSMAALLQAATRVKRLAAANVASKVVWGAGLALAILAHGSLPLVALPLLVSEVLKAIVLVPAVRSAIGLELRIDWRLTKLALVASLPFFLNEGAIIVGNRLTAAGLAFVTPDAREVGWYGATSNLAGLAMLLAPLVEWVVLPLLARAKERSEEEVYAICRRVIEGLLVSILPFTLLISLGADLWVRLAFGGKFAEAAMSLRILSLDFSLVYLAMILSTLLILVGRGWSVTLISVSAVPMRALILVPLVRFCGAQLGPGGGAVGAALTEIGGIALTAALSFWLVGRRAIDARSVRQVAKSLLIVALVSAAHVKMAPLGYARLVLDGLLYLALAVGLGVVGKKEARVLWEIVASRAKRNKRSTPAPPPSP